MKLDTTLYLVTDSTNLSESEFLYKVEQACKGGVTLVQLREKEKSGLDYLALAVKVKKITDRYTIPLLIDDRVDIAMACGAAGVHVGQSDIPVWAARKLLGKEKIVGATAKTVEQAARAANEGADYIGVGAIFPTTTKVKTILTSAATLRQICQSVPIPVVAIGGLNSSNCDILKGIPINGIAVVSAIMKADDPQKAARDLRNKMMNILPPL